MGKKKKNDRRRDRYSIIIIITIIICRLIRPGKAKRAARNKCIQKKFVVNDIFTFPPSPSSSLFFFCTFRVHTHTYTYYTYIRPEDNARSTIATRRSLGVGRRRRRIAGFGRDAGGRPLPPQRDDHRTTTATVLPKTLYYIIVRERVSLGRT